MTSRLVVCAVVLLLAGCKGGSIANPTEPTGGGQAPAAGAWTGTFTRPGGAAPLTVRWQVTVVTSPDDGLLGPMTLTNGSNSVTVQARGNLGGNSRQGYAIHLSFTSSPGDNPAFPGCTVLGSPQGTGGSGEPFPEPYNRISVPSFNINYNSCPGFIGSSFIQELGSLTLTK